MSSCGLSQERERSGLVSMPTCVTLIRLGAALLVCSGWSMPAELSGQQETREPPRPGAQQVAQEIDVPDGQALLIGIATDSTRGTELEGAAIYFLEDPAAGVSDSLGHYALGPVPVGLYRVSFFHPRLDSLGVTAAPVFLVDLTNGGIVRADVYIPAGPELQTLIDREIEADPIMLPGIEVVAPRERRLEERLKEGASVAVVSREQIAKREESARHIGDLLVGIPGLRVSQPTGGVLCVESRRSATIRGTSQRSPCRAPVLVWLDGTPLADPEYTLMNLRPRDIERVEFINGLVAGARYGTGSANGVLLVETRRPF